jgi:hypothetical protein
MNNDLAMLGPYANGNDGTEEEEVVFAVFMGENHAGLTPLERFGFVLYPGKMSACYGVNSHQRVECPPEGEPSTAPAQPPAVAMRCHPHRCATPTDHLGSIPRRR